LVPGLSSLETAYQRYLGYQTVDRGTLCAELADLWDTPDLLGRPFIIMQPSSGSTVFLRFIDDPFDSKTAPLTTFGWNATELLVADPDKLAGQLRDSPFRIIGKPRDLYAAPDSPRAMQVQGPAGEVLYLTRIIPLGTRFPLSAARSFVDRAFIAVVGGPSMEQMTRYYRERLGLPVSEPASYRISVLSHANRLPGETTYPLAVVRLPKDFLVELDQYPPGTAARPRRHGSLPPGMAMVSFSTDDLGALALTWRKKPRPVDAFPYNGRPAAVTIGPAGEWLEIIATDNR